MANRPNAETAKSLREFARWIEQVDRKIPLGDDYTIYVSCNDKNALADAIKAVGGGEKYSANGYVGVKKKVGCFVIDVFAAQYSICEKVSIGKREVTKEIPDPDAPKITVTETVEDFEWRCPDSLLAVGEPQEMVSVGGEF